MLIRLVALSCLFLTLCSCKPFAITTSLDNIKEDGYITMGTLNSSLTYNSKDPNFHGFDYELANDFANYLNVTLNIEVYDDLSDLFQALDDGDIDFIGAGLTLTQTRAEKYRSSPPYYYVAQSLVYRKGTYRPRKFSDINAPLGVLMGSSHKEALDSLLSQSPKLKIDIMEESDQGTLLRKIANKELSYALVDSTVLAQQQRYYPVLAQAFTFSEKKPVAWLIKRSKDDQLYSAIIEFIGDKYEDQRIAILEEKYFGHVEYFDFVDTRSFLRRIETELPKHEALFKKYATQELSWPLLAAVSYQESHWKANAISPTGVRGMMMLTRTTARSLGIKNRLDPEQSIKGGAKYLTQLMNRLPKSILEGEKIWFALASYNIGFGHMLDARLITRLKGGNPDLWTDVKDNLPLLHIKEWYSKTKYGYARGEEAKHYVNSIRQYRKSLTWFLADKAKSEEEEVTQED